MVAPTGRAGYETPPRGDSAADDDVRFERPEPLALPVLVAGVVRAALGALGAVASLLTLPIHFATPVLIGISLLMMVTGCAGAFQASRGHAHVRRAVLGLMSACGVAVAGALVVVAVKGAGAFAPKWQETPEPAKTEHDGTEIRFQMQ
jgi:hypothetical protein